MSHFAITRTIRYVYPPGTVESKRCEICGAACEVRRDVDTYTSMASAMAKRSIRADVFSCPVQETEWHARAVRLVDAIAETPSPRHAALMQLDLDDLLKAHPQE
jgi:hypothetical protein